MNFTPISMEELDGIGRRIDPVYVIADYKPDQDGVGMNGPDGMYDRLRSLEAKYGRFVTLRGPVIIAGKLVMFVVRPRNDGQDAPTFWPEAE